MSSQATQILQAISIGDRSDVEKLLQLVYEDLCGLARAQLGGDTPKHTLDPTAVVHEVFLKLIDRNGTDWQGEVTLLRCECQDHAAHSRRPCEGKGGAESRW
jgi:RNA polymerase sigma-70 factor (ECF subfamily)